VTASQQGLTRKIDERVIDRRLGKQVGWFMRWGVRSIVVAWVQVGGRSTRNLMGLRGFGASVRLAVVWCWLVAFLHSSLHVLAPNAARALSSLDKKKTIVYTAKFEMAVI
jgi:hypothetical protein